jgi:hypothetical protein
MHRILITLGVLGLAMMGFSQGASCTITVTNPTQGDVWIVGQTYSLTWTRDMHLCPTDLNRIELYGETATNPVKLLNTGSTKNDGSYDFTPTADLPGYSGYFFKFWVDGGESNVGTRSTYVAGQSEVFQIKPSAPPLQTDPASLDFILSQGDGSSSQTLNVISNQGAIPWVSSSDQGWLTSNPTSGTSVQDGGPVPVQVTASAAGLAPGSYLRILTFTAVSRFVPTATVPVTLTVASGGEGTPDLEVEPRRLVFTQRLGSALSNQEAVLKNTGSGGTAWHAESVPDWLTIMPSSGELNAGAARTLTFSITGSFSLVGSHRMFVHFKGVDKVEAILQVDLNLTPGMVQAGWPPPGKPRITLPVAANTQGAYDSFWSTDIWAFPVAGVAAASLEALSSPDTFLPAFSPDRLDAIRRSMATQTQPDPRGSHQFIWGAVGAKSRTTAATMEFEMLDTAPVLLSDLMGLYFETPNASAFVQIAGVGVEDLILASRTYSTDADSNTFGQSVTPPGPDEIIGPEGGTAYVPGLRNGAAYRSNLFITELSGVPATVTVQLFDAVGQTAGLPQTKIVGGFSQWQIINAGSSLGTNEPWTYAAVMSEGGGQITALGSVVDNTSQDPTTIAGRVARSTTERSVEDLVLPAVVRAPGAYETQWRSDLVLLNAGDGTVTATVQFIPNSGAGAQETVISLPPKFMGAYVDIVSTMFQKDQALGTVRIRQVNPGTFFAFNRIYNLKEDGSTFGQGTQAYTADDAAALGAGTLYLVGLERSPKYRTNVGVVEVAGQPATVLFTVVSPAGESRGYLRDVAPYAWYQADDIIRAKVGFTQDLSDVWIFITVVEGTGSVLGYGSVIDNDSSDATFFKPEKR